MRVCTSANAPLDFCDNCAPTEEYALKEWGNVGDGPDDRGNCFDWDSDHPDYNDHDYKCNSCGLILVDKSTTSWLTATVVKPPYAQASY